jgi:hypothetical protein
MVPYLPLQTHNKKTIVILEHSDSPNFKEVQCFALPFMMVRRLHETKEQQ